MTVQPITAALQILTDNVKATNWNFYPSIKLKQLSGCSNDDLNRLYKEGKITTTKGINDTLIILKDVNDTKE